MVRLLNHECKNIVKVTYNLIIQNIHNTIWLSLIKRFLGGNYFIKLKQGEVFTYVPMYFNRSVLSKPIESVLPSQTFSTMRLKVL